MSPSAISSLVSFFSLLLAVEGCGLASSGSEGGGGNSESAGAGSAQPASVRIDTDTLVTIDRDECYGVCPAYSLSIAGDGTVKYVGRSYVKVKGPASAQVARSDVQSLVDQLLEADYFNLSVPVDCPAGTFTDASTVTTSLALGGRTHSVQDYKGDPCVPKSLSGLEDAIDAVANSAQWVKCDAPNGFCYDP